MFEALYGNKNIQKILIFLFVNGKCYGTQIHRLLNASLTPIQKALTRLEKGGIILSYYEGKTRLYQFNPAFPLLEELEQLLRKTYTLLPPYEKKDYYATKKESGPIHSLQILRMFWEKLAIIKQMMFHAKTKSKEESGWNGKGKGEVIVTKEGHTVILFTEKGSWKTMQGEEVSFSNIFRWTLDRNAQLLTLEHLRRGSDHPVFLFHLTPSGERALSSVDSHFSEENTCFGQIHFDQHGFRLTWREIGSKKNEEVNYYYF